MTSQPENAATPALAAFPKADKLPDEPRTVLVADDEHLVASGIASSLREMGFTVVGPVGNGVEAVERAERERPDIALLDIRMPKMDGLAASEILFNRFGIPVVIFSAFSDAEYVSAGTRAGVFGYLLKPVTQDQLRVGVSVAWGRFRDFIGQDTEIHSLRERLENRKIIEQAKWIIVKRKNVTEPEAMKLLQKQARNNRRSLVDVARSLLESDVLITGESE